MWKWDIGKWDIGRRDIFRCIKKLVGETGHYALGIGTFYCLWDSGHPLGNGTWEMGHAILWDSDHLSSGKYPLGMGNLEDEVQPSYILY